MDTKKPIKILLIDNNKMMEVYFRDIFWIHGEKNAYEVLFAHSLEEAENIINNKETRPDTIFFDILLSGEKQTKSNEQLESSFSFIKKIKNDELLSKINIVIFSDLKEDFLKEEVKDLRIEGYLVKGELMPKDIISFTNKIHESNN